MSKWNVYEVTLLNGKTRYSIGTEPSFTASERFRTLYRARKAAERQNAHENEDMVSRKRIDAETNTSTRL